MNAIVWSIRFCAPMLAALSIAGCATPNGSAVPGGAAYASSRSIRPDRRTVSLYDDPYEFTSPDDITAGPDGALWFTSAPHGIGRITTGGVYTMTINPGLNIYIENGITVGPDRNIWFTASQFSPNLALIGRVTTGGTVTFFTDTGGYFPERITSGPDNDLWFTEANGTVGRLTTNGRRIRHFTVGPSNAVLGGIVTGPDGNLWVTAFEAGSGFGNKVYRLTPQGGVTSYTVGSGPDSICVGPDNALWFTEYRANAIGRITLAGKLTQFPTGQPYGEPSGIVTGPDNALWFTDFAGRFGIGRIRRDGKMTFTRVPHRRRFPPELNDIIVGPDNAMWFTSEIDPSAVGRMSPN